MTNVSTKDASTEHQEIAAPRLHIVLRVLLGILLVGLVSFVLMVVGLILIFAGVFGDPFPSGSRAVDDPSGQFTRITGLDWPATANIISVGDNHGGFSGDGEFHLIFEVERETLERWLAQPPPWNQHDWKTGPVPPEIGFHCRFGKKEGVSAGSTNGGPQTYAGNPELVQVLGSSEISFVAQERCCQSIPWHNGSLLIIDLANQRVWLSKWDF